MIDSSQDDATITTSNELQKIHRNKDKTTDASPINHQLTINTTISDESYDYDINKLESQSYDDEIVSSNELYDFDRISHEISLKPKEEHKTYLSELHSSTIFLICNLSAYSILGVLLRYVISELFNNGCQDNGKLLCVTSATSPMFIDLPANMLGCFFMGLLSTSTKLQNANHIKPIPNQHILPFLHPKHYFQNWSNMHLVLRTGFCGSLTTFASWNTQMVIMISTGNVSTILSALFGYVIGIHTSYMSLKFGQHLSLWVNDNKQENIYLQNEIQHNQKSHKLQIFQLVVPYIIIIPLLSYFIMHKYRSIWLSIVLAPLGTILRWRLSKVFNKQDNTIPYYGTFYANILGSIISILSVSFLLTTSSSLQFDTLNALKLGLAGCLSTVSTLMDEYDTLLCSLYHKKHIAYTYVYGTIGVACIISLFIHIPMSLAY